MSASAARHWDTVYAAKALDEVSWFQATPGTSLRLLTAMASPAGAVLDVGAGASSLAQALLNAGWRDVSVLDVSSRALEVLRDRLGERRRLVSFVAADLLSWQPQRTFDAWHDRAVYHFLIQPSARERYLATATRAVAPGGVLVLATFAGDGPVRCSGLPTARYEPAELAAAFAPAFTLAHAEREEHVTPNGTVQPFTWVVLSRADTP